MSNEKHFKIHFPFRSKSYSFFTLLFFSPGKWHFTSLLFANLTNCLMGRKKKCLIWESQCWCYLAVIQARGPGWWWRQVTPLLSQGTFWALPAPWPPQAFCPPGSLLGREWRGRANASRTASLRSSAGLTLRESDGFEIFSSAGPSALSFLKGSFA